MLAARVADALRLATLREYLVGAQLEGLVQNRLAERQRRGRAIRQRRSPSDSFEDELSGDVLNRSAMPSASASSASTLRPLKISSLVTGRPVRRGRKYMPPPSGISPRWI